MYKEHAENFPLKYNVTKIIVKICAMPVKMITNTRISDDASQLIVRLSAVVIFYFINFDVLRDVKYLKTEIKIKR